MFNKEIKRYKRIIVVQYNYVIHNHKDNKAHNIYLLIDIINIINIIKT